MQFPLSEMKRVALITGGTRGIGYGIAMSLASEGFDLALCGRRDEGEVGESLDPLRALGREVLYARADISKKADRLSLLEAVKARFGRLHVLVNNAGIAPEERRDLLEATEESFEHLVKTNLQGPYFLTQAVANSLVAASRTDPSFAGCIIFVTSISSTVASTNRGDYCISKAGLSMAAQLWAVRLAEFGVPVYEVRPGIIRTDMTRGVEAKYDRLIEEGLIPQGRWGTTDDVGRAVAMLARGDLAYSTGQVLMIEGGMTLGRL